MNYLLLAADALHPDTVKLIAAAALVFSGVAAMKLKHKAEAWGEDKKYRISKSISTLEPLGIKRLTEAGRRGLAGQTRECIQELHSLGEDLLAPGGLMRVCGPIAVQNLPALMLHEDYGSQVLDQIVDTMPKLLRERPEAWDKIAAAYKQGQKIHDDAVLEAAETIKRKGGDQAAKINAATN